MNIFILLFIVAYTTNALWRMAVRLNWIDMPFYPVDFLVAIIAIALILIQRHIRLAYMNNMQKLKLQKMDKVKDEFLTNTSHEIRNPLNRIINIAGTVLEKEENQLSMESKENLKLLSDIGKGMGHTLNDLTTVTQLNDNKVQLSYTAVDIHTVSTF